MSLMHLTRRAGLLAAATSLTLVLAACGDDDGSEADESPSDTTSDTASDTAERVAPWAPIIETDSDDSVTGLDFADTPEPSGVLEVATITEGDGPVVEAGQNVTFNYFGSLYDSAEPFDESYSAAPLEFPVGVGGLIPGWDENIPGVTVGSRIVMMVPPDQGYGDQDRPGIPGGSTLYFVIDVLDAAPM